MSDLKLCRICLRTEAKMFKYDRHQLKYYYEEVIALKVDDTDSLPKCFCYECASMLHKFHKFKEKCHMGQKVLKQLLWKGPITYESVYNIDRASINLQSPLSIMTITNLVKKYVIQEIHTQSVKPENIEAISYFTDELASVDEDFNNVISRNDDVLSKGIEISEWEEDKIPPSPQTVFVDMKKEAVKLKSECIKDKKTKSSSYKDFLNSIHWRTITLTEEEALSEFRSKAKSHQYLSAAYKCRDCFRGFSKEDMLRRHSALRHSQEPGLVECRFCRVRVRYRSQLRRHLAQHYLRYRCLRCRRVCPFQTSALMHEEYHSGVTMQCAHCGQQFRHRSTYYSHLRTHRSRFVCGACGRAFVSARGLQNHRKLRHAHRPDSPAEEEDVDAHCARCGLSFGSRRAFREHLFQSALHAAEGGDIANTECSAPRKVLAKKEKAKLTNELRERSDEWASLVPHSTKRKRRQKRNRRKPTTCHQCGLHFETQAACMKHHLAAHPGTSFFPPAARHICEVCGASLAPGSVAVHQNIHSRERLHPCATCGKQFHSTIGLRRHLVTHTGEKPFGCPLCDKRFTQSNSMKLHYRTFHLKEPYPKRNRKKHKDVQGNSAEVEVSPSEQDSDCLAEPDISLPEPPAIEPVTDVVDDHMSNEPVHYMPL